MWCPAVPQELFGAAGVEMTVHFLRKGCDKFHSGLGHNKLILTTVDCVWLVPPCHPLSEVVGHALMTAQPFSCRQFESQTVLIFFLLF